MAFEPEPLHELITSYAMELNQIYTQPNASNMTKLLNIINTSMGYGEELKTNMEINLNDLKVWDAITQKYLRKL